MVSRRTPLRTGRAVPRQIVGTVLDEVKKRPGSTRSSPPRVEDQENGRGPQQDVRQERSVGDDESRRVLALAPLVDEVEVPEDPEQHEGDRQAQAARAELLGHLPPK